MVMADAARAKEYLRFIGYYRLSGYLASLVDPADANRERFIAGTSFDGALELYIFDRKLRVLLLDALERIEIAAKAAISNEGSLSKGPFWLCDPANFDHGAHDEIMETLRDAVRVDEPRQQHLFISNFFSKYNNPMPPSWMVMEVLSFGVVSKIYKCTKGELQTKVGQSFGINRTLLISWLHALAFARNVCAHNGQVWDRLFTITPKIPNKYKGDWPEASQDRLYILCCVIHEMMGVVSGGSGWSNRLRDLIAERGCAPLSAMGFPTDWEQKAFWKF